jgi:hypothetical protein
VEDMDDEMQRRLQAAQDRSAREFEREMRELQERTNEKLRRAKVEEEERLFVFSRDVEGKGLNAKRRRWWRSCGRCWLRRRRGCEGSWSASGEA